ncbi:hypothetical protein SEVIR_2G151000v4 [Setaria viridis]|uniref:CUE domain-containing protein n=1 Tax=Setaria viridis TaxID=4556 RepID=A0A4U6VW00_SETVI|nr:uncharacterized protein LOC117845308 isoform X1 [Setaria viridis]TKW32149.1 hypothetical protein SEVIR_2G151000v2 [Setaria viridis]
MSAAVCGKRASSFFEEQQHSPHAGTPPPSKRARFRAGGGGGSPSPPRPRGGGSGDPALVAAIHARFPSVSLEFIEKALEEGGNDFDLATKYLLNFHAQSAECDAANGYQSPNGMTTEDQVPAEDILVDNVVAAPVDSVPWAENLPSSSTQWSEVLVKEMMSASNTDDAKARASGVLEVFERAMTSRIGAEALQNFQKENSVYKEQFEAVIRENAILKKAVAIQHERQKEQDERSQELQQLKQLVVQYQEQVRSLEVNNYALSMHLRQAQQGSSIPGHFQRDIF